MLDPRSEPVLGTPGIEDDSFDLHLQHSLRSRIFIGDGHTSAVLLIETCLKYSLFLLKAQNLSVAEFLLRLGEYIGYF